jgi:hypothetical protein
MRAADGTPAAAVEVPVRGVALIPEVKTFAHPGIAHSGPELEFIREKVRSRQEPWLSGWQKLVAWKGSWLDHVSKPTAALVTSRGTKPWPYTQVEPDCGAAYAHALQWAVTRDERHAKKAVEILDAYAGTLKEVTGPDRALRAGLYGHQFVNAAEIVKHTYSGWPMADRERFAAMLDAAVWPSVKDGGSDYSNWDCGTFLTGLAIGVFEDDPAKFNYSLNRLAAQIPKYVWKSGQCNETARDHNHTQFGIGLLALGCEVAWHQGVDAYKLWDERVAAGFEYTSAVVLGKPVSVAPWARFPTATAPVTRGKDTPYPVYEIVLNHYQTRRGKPLPNTAEVVARRRPEGYNHDVFGFGTLLHSGLRLKDDDAPRR